MPAAIVPARFELREGTPYAPAFGDVYHSAGGAIEQARHVFLQGNGLPARWAGRERFVILETGFGLGLNFLATLHAWRRDPARCARLHYVGVEKHPFTLGDLRTLHAGYPELHEESAALQANWPLLVGGAHRIELGGVVLTLFFADIAVLRDLRLCADALYLDGFSPAKNPDMWTHQVMRAVSRLAATGATAATWSVAASVRDALKATGFEVEKRSGFGGKKEMLVATHTRNGDSHPFSPREKRAVVVGAGLAGASVCERLCASGWQVDLHERRAAPAQEASGNHAGIFHPIVTPDDSIFARMTRAGFLASLTRWRRLGNARWDPCGVLQLARHDKELASQQRAVAGLPPDYAQFVTREEATQHAGVPVSAAGLWFPGSGWAQPASLVDALLDACGPRLRRVFNSSIEKLPDAPIVVLANGAEALRLCSVPHLRLRSVRGQVTYLPEDALDPPHVVVLRGGGVIPPVDGKCVVGATYDLEDPDPALREDSHAGNLERLKAVLGIDVRTEKPEGRVGFRSVAPDRLPIAGKLGDGVYGAFAYGSRGLIWATLAAELIASELNGEPLPIEAQLVESVSPSRFKRRAEARGWRP
ncbi:MAG TPA: bifunctional tRNA (5-methylaminomethyl-2-thiouridine)(34)-methyltransferase MnmD/FAD-dependent 5-carboxymethylaminomethyl-2-thiouridine(34) oxidoreductase MnmC [Burkholderiales bacterium]